MFNEGTLEEAIMELFEKEGYSHVLGDNIHKEKSEILLIDDLKDYILKRYKLSDKEIDTFIREFRTKEKLPLYDANKEYIKMFQDGIIFKRDDINQKDLHITLFDFDNINNNVFKIVNQLEIKGLSTRIPDGIIYINGIPVVVLEFKSSVKENTTIMDAFTQLTVRYRRDIEDLFKYNAFVVISDGVNNKFGSLFSKYDYFYSWKNENDELNGIDSLYSMVHGLFNKNVLLDIIRNFIYFPDNSSNELKVVCRYPQFFATNKLLMNIKEHIRPDGDGLGGTYFGATGCGKSYTMLFLTRKLMKDYDLGSPTILLITDRTDLDSQLSETFENAKNFIGDQTIKRIENREFLKQNLTDRPSGGVFLTTIQKFSESISLLSERSNIICISDEAHRTQVNIEGNLKIDDSGVKTKYGFAYYLRNSLPNATYVGFTGTPIDKDLDVFGKIVDTYTMKQSVDDGITVNIVYEGRSAKVILDNDKIKEIEDYYKQCEEEGTNEYQIEASKKATTHIKAIIGDDDVIRAVANDLINHYENRVNEKATVNGKAMIVCLDREIAYKLYKEIIKLRPSWGEAKLLYDDSIDISERELKKLKPIPMINMVMTSNKDDQIDLYNKLKEYSPQELDRQFKNKNSNFKIAIVVDMWVTGFDVPSLDTMYIYKPLVKHTLIQTISRVNRVYPGKDKGLIVDYFGIKSNMNDALKMYNGNSKKEDTFEDIEKSVTIFKSTLDVLKNILYTFDDSKFYDGTALEKLDCLKNASEFVQSSKDIEERFMKQTKTLKVAYNLCSSSDLITVSEKEKMYFYLAIRSIIYKLTKGDAPDTTQMNNKVNALIQEAVLSDGVEELFKSENLMHGRTIDIFSKEYVDKINQIELPNTRAKMLQRLLKMMIIEYGKVNKLKSSEFSKRLQELVDKYNARKYDESSSSEVINDVIIKLNDLFDEVIKDKNSFNELGINFEEKAFYDILLSISQKYNFEYPKDNMIMLAKEIKNLIDETTKYTDWYKKPSIKAEIKVRLILLLDSFNYPPITNDEVYKEVFEQAENFKKYN